MERKKYGLPVIIKNTDQMWDNLIGEGEKKCHESFMEKLPPAGLKLVLSIQQNGMFILSLPEDETKFALENHDYTSISNNLYRIQKLAEHDYVFRHHLETQIIDSKEALNSKKYFRVQSLSSLFGLNPVKVKIDVIGNITLNHD